LKTLHRLAALINFEKFSCPVGNEICPKTYKKLKPKQKKKKIKRTIKNPAKILCNRMKNMKRQTSLNII